MSRDMQFNIASEQRGASTVLRPEGDVDMSRSAAFRSSLREALQDRPDKLVIDLQQVEYMDSSGVATLVEAARNARGQKVPLVLCGLTPKVKAVFEIARLHLFFEIADSSDNALDG